MTSNIVLLEQINTFLARGEVIPEEEELLEVLAKRTGCNYLSDLREKSFQRRAVRAVLEFSQEAYSASQWRDATGYLLHLTDLPPGREAARALLQGWEAAQISEN